MIRMFKFIIVASFGFLLSGCFSLSQPFSKYNTTIVTQDAKAYIVPINSRYGILSDEIFPAFSHTSCEIGDVLWSEPNTIVAMDQMVDIERNNGYEGEIRFRDFIQTNFLNGLMGCVKEASKEDIDRYVQIQQARAATITAQQAYQSQPDPLLGFMQQVSKTLDESNRVQSQIAQRNYQYQQMQQVQQINQNLENINHNLGTLNRSINPWSSPRW